MKGFRVRIPLIYKRIWNYFGALFFASIVFFVGYMMFHKGSLKLQDLSNYTGIVTDKGIISNNSSVAGRGSTNRDVFFFKIKGLKQTLALYNMSQDYTAFNNNINKKDTVTVYFLKSRDSLKPNLDVFQLEKSGAVIQSIDNYAEKEGGLGYVVFMMGFVFIGMGIYQDKKYWNKDYNEK